jgi:hypothetical protein
VLFGLGAIGLATNPDGLIAMYARYLQDLLFGRVGRRRPALAAGSMPLGDISMDVLHGPGVDETQPDSTSPQLPAAAVGAKGVR